MVDFIMINKVYQHKLIFIDIIYLKGEANGKNIS